ncbi:MFS general substrate transporter [Aspergillus vadensis CBS 113365]|uniref:MFS general substrate transporter n=1 Tax=Aspergillus vadensis (strain CBS 113365 / IMI 142717 / IBT 24658) TaxID=1448311 RepID=A0A319C268_ASPVC|nr:MFS general substrate transporter [Aspergillus vadensis CBS 113365]PYH69518.1 MFS general substrate transporter [Aspergillus vadensis CBS 113365]
MELEKQVDGAAAYLAHSTTHPPMTLEMERKLLRKIDCILVPMLLLTATLGAVDKVALSTAAIYGLEKGYLEAIIVPTISLIVAGFYKKTEQPPRNAIVFAAFSSVINGFLSWAVGHIPDSAPLAIWQYLYLIVVWSITAFVILPESPMTAFFFTDRERFYATQRLAENQTGIINKEWKREQALEAVLDVKTWILFSFNIAINIPNGGLTTFSGILINNLGFTAVKASLLNMPTGVMSTVSAFFFSWLAARWSNRRCLVTMMACCLPIVGSALVYSLPRTNLYTYFGPYVVGISMAQANTAGHTKKTVQYSILYIGYALGNLIGPQTFRASQAPAYTGGFIAMLICYCICVGLMGLYWVLRCIGDVPRCTRCRTLDLTCEEFSFVEEPVEQGVSLGRRGTCSKQQRSILSLSNSKPTNRNMISLDAYSGRWVFLNLTMKNYLEDTGEVDYDSDEDTAMKDSIGPDCSLSSNDNPYINLLTPLAFCHPTLRNAMVSVAANQLRLLGDARYTNEAALYKDRAIQGLQQAVELRNIDDGIIGTILMLCFYDISDKCDSSWVKHLEAGLDLLNCLPLTASSSQGLRKFFQMYFVAHDIMRRTATPGMINENGRYGWQFIPRTDKRTLVNKMIDLISSLPDSATLLWPLYVLGQTALDDQDHRRECATSEDSDERYVSDYGHAILGSEEGWEVW